ncbi:MAG: hypothetical protein ACKVW3_01715 [Phycisphaerales bacterium]
MTDERHREMAREFCRTNPVSVGALDNLPRYASQAFEEKLAVLLADAESAQHERTKAVALHEALAHRDRAKAMQAGLLKKRDPVYGIGTADSVEWDKHQRSAGCAAAIAEAIRALTLADVNGGEK